MLHDYDFKLGIDQSGKSFFSKLNLRNIVSLRLWFGCILRRVNCLLWPVGCDTQTAKILPEEHEKVLILDPAVMIKVHLIEQMFVLLSVALGSNVFETFIKSNLKLVKVHESLFAP